MDCFQVPKSPGDGREISERPTETDCRGGHVGSQAALVGKHINCVLARCCLEVHFFWALLIKEARDHVNSNPVPTIMVPYRTFPSPSHSRRHRSRPSREERAEEASRNGRKGKKPSIKKYLGKRKEITSKTVVSPFSLFSTVFVFLLRGFFVDIIDCVFLKR